MLSVQVIHQRHLQLKAYADGAFPQRSVQEGPVQQRIPPNFETVNLEIKLEIRLTGKLKNLQLVPGLRQGKFKGWKKKEGIGFFYQILLPSWKGNLSRQPTETAVKPKVNDFFPCTLDFNKNVPPQGHKFCDLTLNFGEKLHSNPGRMN